MARTDRAGDMDSAMRAGGDAAGDDDMQELHALRIARFFPTATASVWHELWRADRACIAHAQRLFEQMAARPSPASTASASARQEMEKAWAVAAVVAAKLSSDVAQSAEKRSGYRKRKRGAADKSVDAGDDECADMDVDEDARDSDSATSVTREPEPADAASSAWSLTAFLVESHTSLSSVLLHVTGLLDRLLLEPDLLRVTTQLKEDVTVASVLFEKYRALWKKLELQWPRMEEQQGTSAHSIDDSKASVVQMEDLRFRFGWLLFLVLRRRLNGQFAGLGQLYFLLLAVMQMVIEPGTRVNETQSVEAEVAATLSALGAAKNGVPASTNGHIDDDTTKHDTSLLALLCEAPRIDPRDVELAHDIAADELVRLTLHDGVCIARTAVPDSESEDDDQDEDPVTVTKAVLEESVLRDNVARLSEYYAQQYVKFSGHLDERVFLDESARHILVPPTHPAQSRTPDGTPAGHCEVGKISTVPVLHTPSRGNGRRDVSLSTASSPATTPLRRGSRSDSASSVPPSPFTAQAWQWHGSSPPPSFPTSLTRSMAATPNTASTPGMAQTPVTAAVETNSWIRSKLLKTEAPSAVLQQFFQTCANDPSEAIALRLKELTDRLKASRRRAHLPSPGSRTRAMLQDASEVDASLDRTQSLARSLFYSVLEALLRSERKRLRTENFSSLLHNDAFVTSLFACSLEVLLKAQSLITLSFPFLLDTLQVNAFDFGKIIESFVKHAPMLPSTLKRHMRDLEQVILDSLAWRSDSGLYSVLTMPQQPTPPSPPKDAASPETTSPPQESNGKTADPVASSSTTVTASAPAAPPRTTVLQLFFRKVLSLAATRIHRLGNALGVDASLLNQVWMTVKECLSAQHDLMRDRHLDQIVLCSLYGVCRVNHVKPEVSFKSVINAYKTLQPAAQGSDENAAQAAFASATFTRNGREVIRDIQLDKPDARGDIIAFYNRCFIPTMKVFLLQLQVQDRQLAAAAEAVASTVGRDGMQTIAASTSDAVIVAEAAASAVEKVMQSYGTPRRNARRSATQAGMATPPLSFRSPSRNTSAIPLFSTAEVESLPVSVHQASPKRVPKSNVYMSPLQNARLHRHRSQLSPQSHALYAFGESPSRDLALINRAVNPSGAQQLSLREEVPTIDLSKRRKVE